MTMALHFIVVIVVVVLPCGVAGRTKVWVDRKVDPTGNGKGLLGYSLVPSLAERRQAARTTMAEDIAETLI